ncbi:MAG TPA: hypothetical protein VKR54_01805 [Candidatus Babeliales bacterium]|nr:hypothetical protein [Candidatus Babeliales bacterium]
MTLSHKTLLTISCLSFSLHSMEEKPRLQSMNYYYLTNVYRKAYNTLENYDPANIQSAIALTEMITKTKELKKHNIEESNLRLFVLQQSDSIKDKIFSYGKPPYNGPHYVSVFFARLAQYNAHLAKNEYVSPTIEQFTLHKNNRRIITASNNALRFRLFFDLQKINADKKLLTDFSPNVALDDFEHLIGDIQIMLQTTPDDIKTIAQIVYGETLTF